MKAKITLIVSLACVLAASAQTGGQEQLARSIKEAHDEAVRTDAQLKATVEALNALTKKGSGDLRAVYTAYCAEVSKTETVAASTKNRIQWMAGDGRKYFQDWQNTVNSIANESLRKKAQKRLNTVTKNYNDVEEALGRAGDKFKPFLSDLGDIQKSLAMDVTPGGVDALKSTVRSANWNYKYVDRAINSAMKEMQRMQKELTPQSSE